MPDRAGTGHSLPLSLLAMGLLCACGETVDPVGYNLVPLPDPLNAISCPATYPANAYGSVLGKTDASITAKLEAGFAQLFHGDLSLLQPIYFPGNDAGTAYIFDTLHLDTRTEGLGLGMLIAVSLNKQTEFDALWRYAKAELQVPTGADAGYFRSRCDITDTEAQDCLDPYGLEQFTTALLLARQRWTASAAGVNYGADARGLLSLIRTKVIANGGVIDGVTNTFDSHTMLAYDVPDNDGKPFLRTALAIPSYYDLWAQVTGDAFYNDAARAARSFLEVAAAPSTGLYPIAANFDGSPRKGSENFAAAAFRVDLNLVLDGQWGKPDADQLSYQVPIINRMLAFFTGKGLTQYGSSYTLEGTELLAEHAEELVMANGVIASMSTATDRVAYIQAAWDVGVPVGPARYYKGLMYLMGNLLLSGRLRICP